MLFDWRVVGQILAINPAHAVRRPKHVAKRGKTPVREGPSAPPTISLALLVQVGEIPGVSGA